MEQEYGDWQRDLRELGQKGEGDDKTCLGCKFCICQDVGYSNYTVEGTDFLCAKKLHPEGRFDRWYGEDPRLKFAQKCTGFEHGEPIEMDVGHENYDGLTQEQKEIFDSYDIDE